MVVGSKATSFWNMDMRWRFKCVCFEEAGERKSAKKNSILDTEEASMSGRIIIGISTGGSLWMHIVH